MKRISASKLISVILVIAVMISVIGCGKKEAEKSTLTPTVTPTATAPVEPTGETGTLSNLEGDVQVLRSGASNWIAATAGMRIGTGDGLKTGAGGYVLITFFDGSVMEVEADSEISVEELSKTSGGSTTVHINQVIGNTINRVENLVDSSSNYEVETTAGSAVVRGTVYSVAVEQFGYVAHTCISTSNQSDVQQHSVVFSNNGKTVNISESMSACCWEGGVPSDPFYSDPADDPLQITTGDGGGGSVPVSCSWTGTWCTTYGQMVLVQNDSQVTGCYSYYEEGCYYQGFIVGDVSGNMLTGYWAEISPGCDSYEVGDFEFTLADGCNSFTGLWRYCEQYCEGDCEIVCEGAWEEDGWSGTRGECPLCLTCPYYDAELNSPDCPSPPQYIAGKLDAGGCRWYRVLLQAGITYRFAMCNNEYYGSYEGGDPVMEIHSYSDSGCELLEDTNDECVEGYGWRLRFDCPETGYYLLKVHEYDDDSALSYILAYYRGTGCY